MKTKIKYIWDILKGSFWFIPLSMVFVSILSAFVIPYIDSLVGYKPSGFFNYFFSGGADSAKSILSTIAGAMIGVAGTVFSITLVALTLASSQFGSRLLRNFMYDRLNQIVLGSYIATFVYCLLVLRTVESDIDSVFVPNISVLFSIFLAIVNIILLVFFIHHIAMSIQADNVIAKINNTMLSNIKRLFPKELSEEEVGNSGKDEMSRLKKDLNIRTILRFDKNGYIKILNYDLICSIAKSHNLFVEIPHREGEFLVNKEELAVIYSKESIDDDIVSKIRGAFFVSSESVSKQDPEFFVKQMVEIASRALSPGVNDPFTATTCIDNLTAIICHLTGVDFPSSYRYDDEENLRLFVKTITFDGIMSLAFNQIRQYGESNPTIIIRLMESFIKINELSLLDIQRESVERHVMMIYKSARDTIKERNDFKDLQDRYEKFKSR